MNNKNYFSLFANCLPVKGHKRSIICDLQKGRFEFIPNALYEILTRFKGKMVKEIKRYFQNNESIIDEYFDFLENKHYGTWLEQRDPGLTDLNLEHFSPEILTNGIIEVDARQDFDLIARELNDVRCKALQLRFFESESLVFLVEKVVESLSESTVRSLELVLPFAFEMNDEWLSKLIVNNVRITGVIIHSFHSSETCIFNDDVPVIRVAKKLDYNSCCGVIHPADFKINIRLFTQSLHYNSCLYKKFTISRDGSFKNCPSMPESFGKLGEISLRELTINPRFTKLWKTRKDDINTCKDCEFRYICSDCRAFVQSENKPLKCNYNPYIANWE